MYYYNKSEPSKDDIVFVQVTQKCGDMGFECMLLEYGNKVGFIALDQLKRGKVRCVSKLISIGKKMYMRVMDIDDRQIALTKQYIGNDELEVATNRVAMFSNINRLISEVHKMLPPSTQASLTDISKETSLRLQSKYNNNNMLTMFDDILKDPQSFIDSEFFSDDFKETYLENITRRITHVPTIITQRIELTTYATNGVQAIRDFVKEHNLKILKSPIYEINVSSVNKQEAMDTLKECVIDVQASAKDRDINMAMIDDMTVTSAGRIKFSFM